MTDVLTELRDKETTTGAYDRMVTFDEFNALVDLERALRGRGALRLVSDHAVPADERGTEESNLELGFWRPTCYHYTSPPSGGGL